MTLQVASAIILKPECHIFLQKRGPNKEFPFCWETPGGKVGQYESGPKALERELQEELGLKNVYVYERPVITMAFNPPTVQQPFDISFYVVSFIDQEPVAKEDQAATGYFGIGAALDMIYRYETSVVSLPIFLRHILNAGGSEYLQNFNRVTKDT